MAEDKVIKANLDLKNLPSQEDIVKPIPAAGIIDLTKGVEVTILDGAPYHKAGQKVIVSEYIAEKMKANKWAK